MERSGGQLDARKQAGQWARLYKQVKAAEERLHQAEQDTAPSQTSPSETAKQQEASEFAKQHVALSSYEGTAPPATENHETDERQERLRVVAGDLMYWKGGLKVLKQARLPKWRGYFQWQIEAKIETLQAEYAKLRAEAANGGE